MRPDSLREREFLDRNRLSEAKECPLGRLFVGNKITQAEYQAGIRWRTAYLAYLESIGAPHPFPTAIDLDGALITGAAPEMSDDECELAAKLHRQGIKILKACGTRVLHAVNAVAVYEEPEELGDFEYTAKAAKIGLAALAASF